MSGYRIGNLRALFEAVYEQARVEGNEAEHYFGIKLVNLAREEGMTEDQIWEAISHPKGGDRVTVSYLPVSVWALPGENFIHLHHEAVVRSGERAEGWLVREFDGDSRLVQRRDYATEEQAVEWIEGVGGMLMSE